MSSPTSRFSQGMWFVPYFLKNTVVFLQTSWVEAKTNRIHVLLVLFLLFTPGVNHDPPMKTLLQCSSFVSFLSLGRMTASVLPSNKENMKGDGASKLISQKVFLVSGLPP